MKEIKIEGLRSLKDSGFIPIKPLTILLGENSSGKSTFLRTFPLLRQSIESSTRGPILWYGSFVDFGTFDDAISKFSEDKVVSFSFVLDTKKVTRRVPPRYYRGLDDGDITVKISVTSDAKDKSTRANEIEIDYKDNKLKILFNKSGKILKAKVNKMDLTEYFGQALPLSTGNRHNLFPRIRFSESEHYSIPSAELINSSIENALIETVNPYLHNNTNRNKFIQTLLTLTISNEIDFFENLKNISDSTVWKKRISELNYDHDEVKKIAALLFALRAPLILICLDAYVGNIFSEVKYIAPLRATAERYYRSQDLSVKEVDFQGKNLAMFIKNLTDSEKQKYKEWLNENFNFNLLVSSDGGHLSLRLQYMNSESSYNITDMGFGFCQILPIITQVWYSSIERSFSEKRYIRNNSSEYIIIEQPELHLHPRFQAKLVNAFVNLITTI
ncbi:AAA family ATPase [Photobacterium carnosum]|uniref:AAA family ATPase n=2 Tax=Photobacterium carnosum TaxID=2023717 RepID=UPI001C9134FE|nr:AAA family ATPase [Photobacterium carnosum]MBY3790170.1 AAA family ATPase [Photobacterium carnosum]